MSRLKSRERFVPGGFTFYQPETNWKAPKMASFESIAQAIYRHRQGNPHLAAKHKWPMDLESIREELDAYNAKVCEQMGWKDFVQAPTGGAPAAFFPSANPSDPKGLGAVAATVKKIWAGVRTLNDWLDSGSPPVESGQSSSRASVCARCPKNVKGDFESWFTRPAAEVIRRQLERVSERKLSTPDDARINVCDVCLCPLKLKVHTPLSYINAHLSEEVLRDLSAVRPECWIISERKA